MNFFKVADQGVGLHCSAFRSGRIFLCRRIGPRAGLFRGKPLWLMSMSSVALELPTLTCNRDLRAYRLSLRSTLHTL